jgi:hypothetical protein
MCYSDAENDEMESIQLFEDSSDFKDLPVPNRTLFPAGRGVSLKIFLLCWYSTL